ncbi:MAG: hypothetical protein QOK14_1908, partial [Frankiaceae bacterium]|nr:hypothetical protein [Frankiaceae bacterium]
LTDPHQGAGRVEVGAVAHAVRLVHRHLDHVGAGGLELLDGAVEVVQEPIDQPYGVRDCAFRDPSGNQLRFSQTLVG